MIFKRNTAAGLPVILIDDTDFKSLETSVARGSVTVKYAKEAATPLSTFALDADAKWTELGQGIYLVSFSASELDTNGKFIYVVTVAGILPYFGLAEIRDNTTDVIGTAIAAVTAKLPPNTISDFAPTASTPVYLTAAAQAELDAINLKLPVGTISNFYPTASTPVFLTVATEAEIAAIKADTGAVVVKLPVGTIANFYPTASTPVYLEAIIQAEIDNIKARTDLIPATPACQSDVTTVGTSVQQIINKLPIRTISDFYPTASTPVYLEAIIEAVINAIDDRTEHLPSTPADEATSQAILLKANLIPAVPASQGDVTSLGVEVQRIVDVLPDGTISKFYPTASTPVYLEPLVGAEIDGIKLSTDRLPSTPANEVTSQAILVRTNYIPATPCDQLDFDLLEASIHLVVDKLPVGTISDFAPTASTPVYLESVVSGKINDIKASTGALPASPANEVTSQAILAKTNLIPATPIGQADIAALDADLNLVVAKLPVGTISDFYPTASTPVYLDSTTQAYITLIDTLNTRVPSAPANEATVLAAVAIMKYLKAKKRYNPATVAVPARHITVGMLESIDTFIDATHYLHEELTYDSNGAVLSTAFTEV